MAITIVDSGKKTNTGARIYNVGNGKDCVQVLSMTRIKGTHTIEILFYRKDGTVDCRALEYGSPRNREIYDAWVAYTGKE